MIKLYIRNIYINILLDVFVIGSNISIIDPVLKKH